MDGDRMIIVNPKTGKKEYLVEDDNQVTDVSACQHEPDGTGRCGKCGRKLKIQGDSNEHQTTTD
jgi:hypothetical protein